LTAVSTTSADEKPHKRPEGVGATGTIQLVSIEPADGSSINAGSKLVVRTRVKYQRVVGNSANIAMIIQDQDGQLLVKKPASSYVRTRQGEVELKTQFLVPAQGVSAIQVFVAMFVPEQVSKGTTTAVRASFTVTQTQ